MSVAVKTLATALAVSAVAALGAAATAQAEPQSFNGRYDIAGGSDEFYWSVSSNCATDGCVANIASNRGWNAVATVVGGKWMFNTSKPDGVVCADGSFAPIVIRYSLDVNTLGGIAIADSNGECPGGQVTQVPLQLTKVG